MLQGWVSVYRQIQDHWLWAEKPFSKGQAWIDMLLSANHEDKTILFGRSVVTVKTGSFITSEVHLSERWGWSRQKVRDFLGLLVLEKMITKESDNKKTTIFISNYAVYQPCVNNTLDSEKTPEKHQKNTNNNENNENNYSSLTEHEIEWFCLENDLKVDCRKFLAYYNKVGWKDKNGNSIKDWKAAVVCWSLNEKPQKGFRKKKETEPKEPPSFDIEAIDKMLREGGDIDNF